MKFSCNISDKAAARFVEIAARESLDPSDLLANAALDLIKADDEHRAFEAGRARFADQCEAIVEARAKGLPLPVHPAPKHLT